MSKALLERFGTALRGRNPALAERLQPGISESSVRRKLERAQVHGAIEPVVNLFTWRNGSQLDSSLTQEQASPFPKSIYMFMDLDKMIGDFNEFKECLAYHPEYERVVGHYFPLFWDGSNSWLAVDLEPPNHNRVVLIHTEMEEMVFEIYRSFEELLVDAIRANEENDRLAGF